MPDPAPAFIPFNLQLSDAAKQSRKALSPQMQSTLFDVIEKLAEDPDAFPGRTQTLSRDGRTRLYTHPRPPLQITYEIDVDKRVLYLMHFVAPQVQVVRPVFISYSHNDEAWLLKLKAFLSELEKDGKVRLWDDHDIQA